MSEVEDTGTGVIFTYIGDINNETNAVVIRRKKMCCSVLGRGRTQITCNYHNTNNKD